MTSPQNTLSSALSRMPIQDDQVLISLLHEADILEDALLVVADFSTQTVAYVGNRVFDVMGIDPADLISGGIRKVVDFVKPEQLHYLAMTYAAYVQQARSVDFDPRTVRFLDLAWTAMAPKGAIPMLSTSVALTYTPARDIAWTVLLEVKESDHSLETVDNCKGILRQIKERHNQLHVHDREVTGTAGPIRFTDPVVDKITERELQVLRLLAAGFSTSEVSEKLAIARNTVETHRKKLLEKFDARNVAELINKASKVYWLE